MRVVAQAVNRRNMMIIITTIEEKLTLPLAVTYPLDITKTRMQMHGELARLSAIPMPHRGMLATKIGIIREEGVMGLWTGLTPAVLRQIIYSGIRLPLYEMIRKQLGRNPEGTFAVHKSVAASVTSGALAQLITSPTDLIKVSHGPASMLITRHLSGIDPLLLDSAADGGKTRPAGAAAPVHWHVAYFLYDSPRAWHPWAVARVCAEHAGGMALTTDAWSHSGGWRFLPACCSREHGGIDDV